MRTVPKGKVVRSVDWNESGWTSPIGSDPPRGIETGKQGDWMKIAAAKVKLINFILMQIRIKLMQQKASSASIDWLILCWQWSTGETAACGFIFVRELRDDNQHFHHSMLFGISSISSSISSISSSISSIYFDIGSILSRGIGASNKAIKAEGSSVYSSVNSVYIG